jgi:5-methyltetrahydrofolate--homocysteine methyltransferase
MKSKLMEIIHSGKVLISDGAMGTELQKRGLTAGDCPEEYNISKPEIIKSIYKAYYDAGSDIIETNTFGGTRPRLQKHGHTDKVKLFSKKSAELAKEVCPEGKFVAGSIGPTGEILEPLGSMTAEEAYQVFAEQAEALAEGGADVLFVETMMAIEEAETALKAAKLVTNLPVSATMTFELTSGEARTSWGVDVPTAVDRLISAGADIIGSNCGNGIDVILAVIRKMRELTDIPLLAQPNAGLPEMIDSKIIYRQKPQDVEQKLRELLSLKVNIIGGCCGTDPEYIKFLRKIVP